jgi:hypothetical protein
MKLAQHRLSRRMKFRGLDISIETDDGEVRHWTDASTGEKGKTKMSVPYGYIRRTEGVDGDHVDVFVGPHEDAENVYVIHQRKAPDFKSFDEDKCMLGFHTAEEAKAAYRNHYNDDRFFGSMSVLPFEKFKTKALATFENPGKIAMSLPHRLGCSRALEVLGLKIAMAPPKTLSESVHEADHIARQLRSFARRHPPTPGQESSSNLASKTDDRELPLKAAGWYQKLFGGEGQLGPQAQASQRGAYLARPQGGSVPLNPAEGLGTPKPPVAQPAGAPSTAKQQWAMQNFDRPGI